MNTTYSLMTRFVKKSILRHMIRLWWTCYLFSKLHARRLGTLQFYDERVAEHEFINFILNETCFFKDVREYIGLSTKEGLMQKRRRLILDLIRDAKRRNLLLEVFDKNTKMLWMDDRGRKFMKTLPFLEACAKEYPIIASPLSSAVVALLTSLLVLFWSELWVFLIQITTPF